MNIKFTNDLYIKIINNQKKNTIRKGIREISPGTHFALNIKTKEKIPIKITQTNIIKYKDINKSISDESGVESPKKLKENLKNYYPELNENDLITIISFKL